MEQFGLNQYIFFISTIGYAVLVLVLYARKKPKDVHHGWMLAILIISIVWAFAHQFPPDTPSLIFLSNTLFLVSATLLGVATADYINSPHTYRWLIGGLGMLLLALGIPTISPIEQFPIGQGVVSVNNFSLFLLWFISASIILIWIGHVIQKTRSPLHANRLLFWSVGLLVTFTGVGLILSNISAWVSVGQIIQLVGLGILTYAITSHRLFDIYTSLNKIAARILINILPAVPIIIIVLLIQQTAAKIDTSTSLIISVVTLTAGFLLFPFLRHYIKKGVDRTILNKSLNHNRVVRNYSRKISKTVDVQNLSAKIITILQDLFQVDRGMLLLLTPTKTGYEFLPIPGVGQPPIQPKLLPLDDIFLQSLLEKKKPLLQYEIDLDSDYSDMSPDTREWLDALGMDIFIPIGTGNEIEGLITIGPKETGRIFQSNELYLLQTMADQTVVALQNARLYSELGSQNEKINQLNEDLLEQNERLGIMDKVKSDFITIASHELRTPLTQIKGYTDILAAMNEDGSLKRDQIHEIMGYVGRATSQLENLLTAMLDASQLDIDGMQLNLVETNIDTILRIAVEPLHPALKERRIKLEQLCDPGLPVIQADFQRLVQTFKNLIGNAVKYTPDRGRIQIEAKIAPSNQTQQKFIEVSIEDSGIGINPEFHELIFEKFFRVGNPKLHSTGNTKFKGAGPGLGLSIAKGVIEAHGGRIWVESLEENETRLPGSCFYILLPLQPPTTPPHLRSLELPESA